MPAYSLTFWHPFPSAKSYLHASFRVYTNVIFMLIDKLDKMLTYILLDIQRWKVCFSGPKFYTNNIDIIFSTPVKNINCRTHILAILIVCWSICDSTMFCLKSCSILAINIRVHCHCDLVLLIQSLSLY